MRIGFQGQLGDTYEDIVAIAQRVPGMIDDLRVIADKVGPHMTTVRHVLEDPALEDVIARVKEIRRLEPASKTTGAGGGPIGVGLRWLVAPLDAFIWYRRNPWIIYVVGIGAALLVLRAIKHKKEGS